MTRRRRIPAPLGAALGLLLDRLLPEPPAAVHPVVLFGTVMSGVEQRLHRDAKAAGVVHAVGGLALGLAAGRVLGSTAVATGSAVAGRALAETATGVALALHRNDLDEARRRLPALVGRDPEQLDGHDIARAVVESVAENTVDAVVAPACWAALAGAPGAIGYRAVNTLDSMVGHRDTRYTNYGWASARLDDALAYLPARLTAALVAAVRPGAAGAVWQAVRTQAPSHPSPNAGVAEAAFAAALGLRLGGADNRYGERVEHRAALGSGPAPTAADIERAVVLQRDVTAALGAVLTLAGVVLLLVRPRDGRSGRRGSPRGATPATGAGPT
jgi:adenosylcobinamide-phosphate synthase